MKKGIFGMIVRLRQFWSRFSHTRLCYALTAFLVLAVLCGLEFLFANRLRLAIPADAEAVLPLDAAALQGKAERTDEGILLKEGAYVLFYDVGTEVADVAITASSDELHVLEITVSSTDDGNKNSFGAYVDGRVYTDETAYFRLRSAGEVRTLRLHCTSGTSALLTDVTLNRRPPVAFSFVRVLLVYALLAFLWAIRHFRLWGIVYEAGKPRHRLALVGSLFLCLLTVCLLSGGAGLKPLPYTEASPSAYEQVFSSLLEGRVDLELPFDASILDSLENPYDYTERSDAVEDAGVDRFGPFWDRAYYEGKFYCYFGIAPVLVIFFPVYFLTGMAPNLTLVVLLLLLCGTVALFGALLAMLRYFRLRVPLLPLCIGFPVLFFGSLFPMIAACADMYYTAVAAGLTFLSATLYFGFAALNCSGRIKRRIFFALSGVCLALTIASRPTVVLYAALLIPPFLAVLAEKGRRVSEKMTDAVSFLLPLAVCMLPILWYNAIRFDSPFEFGASYQLTFNDIRYNRLSLSLLGETLMHYFLQAPHLSGLFPYLRPSRLGLNTYGIYFYSVGSIGALCFPLAWFGSAQGFLTRKQPVKKAVYLLALLLPFGVAFCDLCLGGVNIRYMADVMLPLLLVGALVLLEVAGRVNEKCGDGTSFRFFCGAFAVLVLTFLVSFALVFANERNWIYEGAPQFFRLFERIFS